MPNAPRDFEETKLLKSPREHPDLFLPYLNWVTLGGVCHDYRAWDITRGEDKKPTRAMRMWLKVRLFSMKKTLLRVRIYGPKAAWVESWVRKGDFFIVYGQLIYKQWKGEHTQDWYDETYVEGRYVTGIPRSVYRKRRGEVNVPREEYERMKLIADTIDKYTPMLDQGLDLPDPPSDDELAELQESEPDDDRED